MLHDASQIALHPFVMGLHLLVKPLYVDALGACHLLVDGGQRQTALLHCVSLRLVIFYDMRIDIDMTEVLVFRHVVTQHVEVNDYHADRLAHLRSSKTNAFALCQRVPHILDEIVQIRIVSGNILCHFSQYGLPQYINR